MDGDHYLGFGYVEGELNGRTFDEVMQCIDRHPESSAVRNILNKHLRQTPEDQVVYF